MTDQDKLNIAAQALEDSIGGQAACLKAVELTLEAPLGAVPAGSRIHTLVSSCEDCPACVYESDSRYSCERAGYRKFEQRGATHATPDWCPLPFAAAPQPAPQPAAQQSGCTAGTDEECTQRGCATKCPQLQPEAQPTIDLNLSHLDPFVSGLGKAILREMKESLAAQPAAQQEPAGEPVAFVRSLDNPSPRCVTDLKYCTIAEHDNGDHLKYIPLYTRPAVPLTTKRLAELWFRVADIEHATDRQIAYARAIEAEHKIGGAG
jgi:hypothetical protein